MPRSAPFGTAAFCPGGASVAPPPSALRVWKLVAGLCLSVAVCAPAWFPATTARAADTLTLEVLTERAKLAIAYMGHVQLPSGLFEYEYNFLSGKFSRGDNVVRQAGAAVVTAEYAGFFGDADVAERAKAAIAGLVAISVPVEDGAMVARSGGANRGSTGATALALLAELTYFSASGDSQFESERAAWLHALLRMQLPSGGFARAPGIDAESDYYNGETWLALAQYRRLFPDDASVRAALAKADAYLIDRYSQKPSVQFTHWGLMAGSIRHLTDGDPQFLDFLAKLSDAFLTGLRPSVKPNANSCYSVEGLAVAATVLSKASVNADLVGRIVERVEQELTKSFTIQVLPDQTRIELAPDRYLSAPDIGDYAGAFLNGRTTPQARIDSTQHCLSAIMKYMTYLRAQGE